MEDTEFATADKSEEKKRVVTLAFVLDAPGAAAPFRASVLAAGFDLSASEAGKVPARGQLLVPTGVRVAIPYGYYGRVAPRSGLAVRNGITVGAGTIDADYRGRISVVLFNLSDRDFEFNAGARIAQLILERALTGEEVVAERVDALPETERGDGGFGSTGWRDSPEKKRPRKLAP